MDSGQLTLERVKEYRACALSKFSAPTLLLCAIKLMLFMVAKLAARPAHEWYNELYHSELPVHSFALGVWCNCYTHGRSLCQSIRFVPFVEERVEYNNNYSYIPTVEARRVYKKLNSG